MYITSLMVFIEWSFSLDSLDFVLRYSVFFQKGCIFNVFFQNSVFFQCIFFRTGVFSLSIERGLVEIGTCREKGFHQHTKTPPLFEVCIIFLQQDLRLSFSYFKYFLNKFEK